MSTFKQRFREVMLSDLTPLRVAMGWAGIVLGLAAMGGAPPTPDWDAMRSVTPMFIWGAVFFSYGLIKLYSVFVPTPGLVRALNSFVGLWLWSFMTVAHLLLDSRPTSPSEWMLVVLLTSEAWLMAEGMVRHTKQDYWGAARD